MIKKDETGTTIPWKCAICNSCRLITSGYYGCAGKGQCIYGGPYTGYQRVREKEDWQELGT